jgi:predicted molibdopterin-dependent oxidoreductase YjgC
VAAVAWSPPDADSDDLLIKADKNPNTEGLRLQGLEPDGALDTLLGAAARGEVAGMIVHRADLTRWRPAPSVVAALERVGWLVVLDTHVRAAAEFADVVLPLATHAESDGTFTNHARRVQRFARAVAPPGEARAGWDVLGELVVRLGGSVPRQSAAAVFAALAADCPGLRGLTWERLGTHGAPAAAVAAAR